MRAKVLVMTMATTLLCGLATDAGRHAGRGHCVDIVSRRRTDKRAARL